MTQIIRISSDVFSFYLRKSEKSACRYSDLRSIESLKFLIMFSHKVTK
jgi:hypothetical protein